MDNTKRRDEIVEFDNRPRVVEAVATPTFVANPNRGKAHHFFSWLKFKHSNLNAKQKKIVLLVILVLIAGGGFGTYALYKKFHRPLPSTVALPVKQAKPTTEPSRLTGVEVNPELNKRPVTGVIIENSPSARPQSGLISAGIVFEAIAEGGITRFLMLNQEAQPDKIGPVRSVRPYYLDWLMPFEASIAHVGGAPQALQDIKTLGLRDLDQFHNAGAYERVKYRFAPHNMYTSTAKLDGLNQAKGYSSSNFTGFTRKKEKAVTPPPARLIDINISTSATYNSHYDYDPATNSYKRSQGGGPHNDEQTGAQLSPKVVIALVMTRGIASDGQHTNYGTVGSGKAFVFQDGTMHEGSWSKADRRAQLVFKDAAGAVLKLNPGQTWLTMVDAPTSVVFKP